MGEHLLAPTRERLRRRRACTRPRSSQDRRMGRDQWLARSHNIRPAGKARCAMSIPRHARANLATLLRAAAGGNLALMECADAVTGEPRYVICAFGRDGTDFVFTLFGLSPTAIPSTPACRRPQPSQ